MLIVTGPVSAGANGRGAAAGISATDGRAACVSGVEVGGVRLSMSIECAASASVPGVVPPAALAGPRR